MGLLLGLEYETQYDPRVRDELEQLVAALQTQITTGLGVVTPIKPSDLIVRGSGSMTWQVNANPNLTQVAYSLVGPKLLWLTVALMSTTVGGTPAGTLQLYLPNGWTTRSDRLCVVPMMYSDNGAGLASGMIQTSEVGAAPSSRAYIGFYRLGGTNWSAASAATSVYGQILVELN